MSGIYTTILLLLVAIGTSFGNVPDLELSDAALAELVNCAAALDKIPDHDSEAGDSVIAAHDKLAWIPKEDLELLLDYMVPGFITPPISDNLELFKACRPFAERYLRRIEPSLPVMIDKYGRGDLDLLTANMGYFFQLYLYCGLSEKDKLSVVRQYDPASMSDSSLEELFILARGSTADEFIYFVMGHSTVSLFDPMIGKYDLSPYEVNNQPTTDPE